MCLQEGIERARYLQAPVYHLCWQFFADTTLSTTARRPLRMAYSFSLLIYWRTKKACECQRPEKRNPISKSTRWRCEARDVKLYNKTNVNDVFFYQILAVTKVSDLFCFQIPSALRQESDWPLDTSKYYSFRLQTSPLKGTDFNEPPQQSMISRQLLGYERNDCGGNQLRVLALVWLYCWCNENMKPYNILYDIIWDVDLQTCTFVCDSSLHFEDLRNPTNLPGLHIQFHRSDSTASSDRCPGCLVWGVSTELLVLALTGSGMMGAASHIHAYLEQSSCTTQERMWQMSFLFLSWFVTFWIRGLQSLGI